MLLKYRQNSQTLTHCVCVRACVPGSRDDDFWDISDDSKDNN